MPRICDELIATVVCRVPGAGPNAYAVETYTVFHSLLYTAGRVVYRNHIHQHLCNSIVSVHVYHFRMAWDGSQWGVAIPIRKLFMPNSFELLLLILQTISTKSVPNILFKLSIRYIVNACWSSEVKTAGSIRVRSLVEGVTKLSILGIYQKDDSI